MTDRPSDITRGLGFVALLAVPFTTDDAKWVGLFVFALAVCVGGLFMTGGKRR